jgi:hypothetical protein
LVASAAAAAGIAVKVLVKRDEIAPVAIIVEEFAVAEYRPPRSLILGLLQIYILENMFM